MLWCGVAQGQRQIAPSLIHPSTAARNVCRAEVCRVLSSHQLAFSQGGSNTTVERRGRSTQPDGGSTRSPEPRASRCAECGEGGLRLQVWRGASADWCKGSACDWRTKTTARFHAAGGAGQWGARPTLRRAERSVKPDEPMGLEAARRFHLGMLGLDDISPTCSIAIV